MGDKTGISWTDATWNPVVGCSIISPGCINCYAMQWAHNMLDKPGSHYEGTTKLVNGRAVWTGKLNRAPDAIMRQPLKWQRGRRIFVNSMSDLFHKDVQQDWRDETMAITAGSSRHVMQVLTKRGDIMADYIKNLGSKAGYERMEAAARKHGFTLRYEGITLVPWPIPNLWPGVSVEGPDQKHRIDQLRETPAAIRFLSIEPQIEDVGELDLRGIHWVIVGGESGPDARPFHVEWAFDIQRQCQRAGVAFFLKQFGSNPYIAGAPIKLKSKKGQDPSEWAATFQRQEFPQTGARA